MQLSGWNQLTIPRLRLDKLKVQNHCLVKYAELNDVNCIKIFHSYPTALGLKFTNMPFALKGMFVNFKPNAVGYDQKMATVLCSLPENRQGTHWHCTLKIKIKKNKQQNWTKLIIRMRGSSSTLHYYVNIQSKNVNILQANANNLH